MDTHLAVLAERYRRARSSSENVADRLAELHESYTEEREKGLLDAAAASGAVYSLFEADRIDYAKITPQMREAFSRAYPNVPLDSLRSVTLEEAKGFLSGWKGKLFEVIVRDKLNAGQTVGDIQLEPSQMAKLAESATQPGWDLRICDANGSVVEELQLKATNSLGYAKRALERYPDIPVMTTQEVLDSGGALSEQVLASGISDEQLEEMVKEPMESVLDSPLENLAEGALRFLPFIIITVSEGKRFLMGRRSFEVAFTHAVKRGLDTGAAMGVAYLVHLLDGGFVSLPASLLTRLGIRRYRVMRSIVRQLDDRLESVRELRLAYA